MYPNDVGADFHIGQVRGYIEIEILDEMWFVQSTPDYRHPISSSPLPKCSYITTCIKVNRKGFKPQRC